MSTGTFLRSPGGAVAQRERQLDRELVTWSPHYLSTELMRYRACGGEDAFVT